MRELLERLALRLRQEERREDTGEHEEREDLEDVLHPLVRAADVLERAEADLGDDRAELAASGCDPVARRAVSRWEDLSWDDEGR